MNVFKIIYEQVFDNSTRNISEFNKFSKTIQNKSKQNKQMHVFRLLGRSIF